jgi:TPP-dependent pyruvate/acetoin dehydrogenase alpha subunit
MENSGTYKSKSNAKDTFGEEGSLEIFKDMVLVREFEDRVYASFQAGLIQGTTHLNPA